jgi:hypothetical protein
MEGAGPQSPISSRTGTHDDVKQAEALFPERVIRIAIGINANAGPGLATRHQPQATNDPKICVFKFEDRAERRRPFMRGDTRRKLRGLVGLHHHPLFPSCNMRIALLHDCEPQARSSLASAKQMAFLHKLVNIFIRPLLGSS